MKKAGKIAITLGIIAAIGVNVAGIGMACAVRDELVAYGKKHLRQILSINRRLEDMEDQPAIPAVGREDTEENLTQAVTEAPTEAYTSTHTTPSYEDAVSPETEGGDADVWETAPAETGCIAETNTLPVSPADTAENGTEIETAIEANTVGAPSTSQPARTEAEPAATPYELRAYRGIIGVFDGDGRLVETCNVYVMTLPETDREALLQGIQVSSYGEAQKLLDYFR